MWGAVSQKLRLNWCKKDEDLYLKHLLLPHSLLFSRNSRKNTDVFILDMFQYIGLYEIHSQSKMLFGQFSRDIDLTCPLAARLQLIMKRTFMTHGKYVVSCPSITLCRFLTFTQRKARIARINVTVYLLCLNVFIFTI